MDPLYSYSKWIILIYICGVTLPTSHGYWLYDSIGNVASTAVHYISIFADGAEKVASGIKTIENIISDAIEEDCKFTCRNGVEPKPNPKFTPSANGCGSLGVKWEKDLLPMEQLSNCCDSHDYCYDTCNEDKEDCDKAFKRCLYKICDRHKKEVVNAVFLRCKGAAKFMFTGTMALGCTAYKESQAQACICEKRQTEDL